MNITIILPAVQVVKRDTTDSPQPTTPFPPASANSSFVSSPYTTTEYQEILEEYHRHVSQEGEEITQSRVDIAERQAAYDYDEDFDSQPLSPQNPTSFDFNDASETEEFQQIISRTSGQFTTESASSADTVRTVIRSNNKHDEFQSNIGASTGNDTRGDELKESQETEHETETSPGANRDAITPPDLQPEDDAVIIEHREEPYTTTTTEGDLIEREILDKQEDYISKTEAEILDDLEKSVIVHQLHRQDTRPHIIVTSQNEDEDVVREDEESYEKQQQRKDSPPQIKRKDSTSKPVLRRQSGVSQFDEKLLERSNSVDEEGSSNQVGKSSPEKRRSIPEEESTIIESRFSDEDKNHHKSKARASISDEEKNNKSYHSDEDEKKRLDDAFISDIRRDSVGKERNHIKSFQNSDEEKRKLEEKAHRKSSGSDEEKTKPVHHVTQRKSFDSDEEKRKLEEKAHRKSSGSDEEKTKHVHHVTQRKSFDSDEEKRKLEEKAHRKSSGSEEDKKRNGVTQKIIEASEEKDQKTRGKPFDSDEDRKKREKTYIKSSGSDEEKKKDAHQIKKSFDSDEEKKKRENTSRKSSGSDVEKKIQQATTRKKSTDSDKTRRETDEIIQRKQSDPNNKVSETREDTNTPNKSHRSGSDSEKDGKEQSTLQRKSSKSDEEELLFKNRKNSKSDKEIKHGENGQSFETEHQRKASDSDEEIRKKAIESTTRRKSSDTHEGITDRRKSSDTHEGTTDRRKESRDDESAESPRKASHAGEENAFRAQPEEEFVVERRQSLEHDKDHKAMAQRRDSHVGNNHEALAQRRDSNVGNNHEALAQRRDSHVGNNPEALAQRRDSNVGNNHEALVQRRASYVDNEHAPVTQRRALHVGNNHEALAQRRDSDVDKNHEVLVQRRGSQVGQQDPVAQRRASKVETDYEPKRRPSEISKDHEPVANQRRASQVDKIPESLTQRRASHVEKDKETKTQRKSSITNENQEPRSQRKLSNAEREKETVALRRPSRVEEKNEYESQTNPSSTTEFDMQAQQVSPDAHEEPHIKSRRASKSNETIDSQAQPVHTDSIIYENSQEMETASVGDSKKIRKQSKVEYNDANLSSSPKSKEGSPPLVRNIPISVASPRKNSKATQDYHANKHGEQSESKHQGHKGKAVAYPHRMTKTTIVRQALAREKRRAYVEERIQSYMRSSQYASANSLHQLQENNARELLNHHQKDSLLGGHKKTQFNGDMGEKTARSSTFTKLDPSPMQSLPDINSYHHYSYSSRHVPFSYHTDHVPPPPQTLSAISIIKPPPQYTPIHNTSTSTGTQANETHRKESEERASHSQTSFQSESSPASGIYVDSNPESTSNFWKNVSEQGFYYSFRVRQSGTVQMLDKAVQTGEQPQSYILDFSRNPDGRYYVKNSRPLNLGHNGTHLPPINRDKILRDITETVQLRHDAELRRAELIQRANDLQSLVKEKREKINRRHEFWHKKYIEESSMTRPLEAACSSLRVELNTVHRRLIAHLEGRDLPLRLRDGPSKKANYKIMAARLQHEIKELQQKAKSAKLRLESEVKLKEQADREVRDIRNDLAHKKVVMSLARSQIPANLPRAYDPNGLLY